MKYELIRDVTIDECNWLDRNFKKGEMIYCYFGYTFGKCNYLEDDVLKLFELPNNAVEEVNEYGVSDNYKRER